MTQFTKYSRYGNGYVTNTRARKILAARLKLTLDAQSDREGMAGMEVPLVIESEYPAKQVRKDAVTPQTTDDKAGLRQSVPSCEATLGPDAAVEEKPTEPTGERRPGTATEGFPMESVDPLPASATSQTASVSVSPAKEEHSGNVTLYLPKDLNQWLRDLHDSYDRSYPDIVRDAISWAASTEQFSRIFARDDCTVPANDLFGRAPALLRKSISPGGRMTRPVRFNKADMQVIVPLAREWTAGNRNAFFIEVLAAYRDHQLRSSVATND